MYCPQCATPNADDAKFCRSCGKELEAVALALSGKSAKPDQGGAGRVEPKTAQDWMEKHVEGVSSITRGGILLAVPLLVGAAAALFMPASFAAPWIMLAKSRLRLLGLTGARPTVEAPAPRGSVTEGTTRRLDDSTEK